MPFLALSSKAAVKRLKKVPAIFTILIGGVLVADMRNYGMGRVRVSRAIQQTPASVLFRFDQTMQMV
jgi:hypothetical protein